MQQAVVHVPKTPTPNPGTPNVRLSEFDLCFDSSCSRRLIKSTHEKKKKSHRYDGEAFTLKNKLAVLQSANDKAIESQLNVTVSFLCLTRRYSGAPRLRGSSAARKLPAIKLTPLAAAASWETHLLCHSWLASRGASNLDPRGHDLRWWAEQEFRRRDTTECGPTFWFMWNTFWAVTSWWASWSAAPTFCRGPGVHGIHRCWSRRKQKHERAKKKKNNKSPRRRRENKSRKRGWGEPWPKTIAWMLL